MYHGKLNIEWTTEWSNNDRGKASTVNDGISQCEPWSPF